MFVWGGSHKELMHQSIWKKNKAFEVSFIKALKRCMKARGRKGLQAKWGPYTVFSKKVSFFVPLNVTRGSGGSRKPELLAHTWAPLSSDNKGIKRSWAASAGVKSSQTPSKGPKVAATNFMTMNMGPSRDQASERRRAGECSSSPSFHGDGETPPFTIFCTRLGLWAQTVP